MALTSDQVATEILNTMSYARQEANAALGASAAMVNNAVSILYNYSPDYPPDENITLGGDIGMGTTAGPWLTNLFTNGFDATEKPPSFPEIRTPNTVNMGELGDIDTLDTSFTAEAPTLNLPAFDYSIPTALNPFIKTVPEIDNTVTIPEVPDFEYGTPDALAPFTQTAPDVDSSITVPEVPTFSYQTPSPLDPFSKLAPDIDSTVDVSDLPTFDYTLPAPLTPFTQTAPDIDSSVDIPEAPGFSYPNLPELLALNTDIELNDLVIPPLSLTEPSYNNLLTEDFFEAFATGRTELPNYDQYGMELVNRFYPGVQATVQTLVSRASGVLDGTQTALTDVHDARYYDVLRNRIAAESEKALAQLSDATKAAGWDLPGATRAAGAKRIQQEGKMALNNAALEVYVKRADRELQHLQFIMQVVPTLQSSAVALFGQAWGMQMQAFQAALSFAETAMKFATAVYGLKQRDYELAQGLVERQIRIFEALLKAELAKADITQKKLEVERLKAEVNQQQVSLYSAQLQGEETKARVYASQIDALRQSIEARKLPLDVFLAQVKGFSALTDAKRAEYAMVEAQISGDRAKTSGKLDALRMTLEARKFPLDVFLAEIQAYAALSGAKRAEYAIVEAQISGDKAKITSQLEALRLTLEARKIPLDVFMAEVQAYSAQADAKKSEYSLIETQISKDKAKIGSQLDALRLTLEARKIPLDVFIAEVQGYTAQANAKKSEYSMVEAQISGDKAKTDGELAKLRTYEAQASVYGTVVGAKSKRIDSQVQRNNQILEEFKTRMQAEVQLTQMDAAIASQSLDAYKAMSAVYVAETQSELERAKFEFSKALEDAKLELEQTKLSYERQFRALGIEMARVKAVSDVTLAGAEVQARTGQAAISVMNTMTQLSASASA